MPTHEEPPSFLRAYQALTPAQRAAFRAAVSQLVDDLRARRQPHPALRVKRVKGVEGIWEMSWAADGRATFEYGTERVPGDAHVVWRRIGTHAIFRQP